MRQSKLFGKTRKEKPSDEIAKNAILLEQGGFIYKTMAGVYDYLPLGFRVLERINAIIREEMNAIGGQELFLSALQPRERWEKTGRWEKLKDIMYQFKDNSGHDVGLATTHEEALARIATHSIQSYKDLPLFVYQIQTKFRDEPRAKSGLMRGREFLMKDLYSFHTSKESLNEFYEIAGKAYERIFERCNLTSYKTEAGGGTFTNDITHEYQVLSEAGEDTIFYCEQCGCAQNKEIANIKEGDACSSCKAKIKVGKSIEVGNIFRLGTVFSETFNLLYSDEKGQKHPVWMGSYGIGPGRLLATIVEVFSDEKGIRWPSSVAPFQTHLISIPGNDLMVEKKAEEFYATLNDKNISVLFDDRKEKSPGEKFADADLIGIPLRIVISSKTLKENAIEIKKRDEEKTKNIPYDDIKTIISYVQ
ncbi:MAG: aminoacyl--tRNA ligase-related protein [bacterium]|nr:aminoacyl--tRNA ligase-related protein [bacterium]